MMQPVAPTPSSADPWTVRFAYWYIDRRATGARGHRNDRVPHLSSAADHAFLYPPMAGDGLAALVD